MKSILEVDNLRKSFNRDRMVLDGVNLKVSSGDVYLLLGHNGAGKSTLFSIIVGLYQKYEGNLYFKGKKERSNIRVSGFLETPAFYPDLTGIDNLYISYGLRKQKPNRDIIYEYSTKFNIYESLEQKVGNYSTGMVKRLGLVRSLLFDPDLIILDEPTNGLDPRGVMEMRNSISFISENLGKTILFSSHIIAEAEKIASKVGILKNGQIILEKEVNTRGKLETVKIISSDADRINNYLEQRKIGRIIERTTQGITYEIHKGTSEQLVTEIISNGMSLSEIYRIKDDLEKLYFDFN